MFNTSLSIQGLLRRAITKPAAQPVTTFNRQQAVAITELSRSLRLLYFQRLFELLKNVSGDIVECGVGYGDSLLMLHILNENEGCNRRVWGVDSFQGFPESPEVSQRTGSARWSGPTLRGVYDTLLEGGIPNIHLQTRTTLIGGFFTESLPKYTGDSIALLHLDVDLGESYATCLSHLWHKVNAGGVIAFDEYMGTWEHHKFPQAQVAITSFLRDNGCALQRDERYGKYYAIKPEP